MIILDKVTEALVGGCDCAVRAHVGFRQVVHNLSLLAMIDAVSY